MDDLESIVLKIIDQFTELQEWASRPEKSRKPSKIYKTILNLDSNLKDTKKFNMEHPLQELSNEVRDLFNTQEFRKILLDAFNWRSAKAKKIKLNKKQVTSQTLDSNARAKPQNKINAIKNPKHPKHPKKNQRLKAKSPARTKLEKDAANLFAQQIFNCINGIPDETRRQIIAKKITKKITHSSSSKNYIDMYQAGRRQHGSYGSKQ